MGTKSYPRGLETRLAELFPDVRIVCAKPLGDDGSSDGDTKAHGYGRPLHVTLDNGKSLVFHTVRADEFGHDRRSDRIANAVLAYDTFPRMPRHVAALDVGVIDKDGTLRSLASGGEPYFITPWSPGTLYADDLERIAKTGEVTERDLARVDALVAVLREIHAAPGTQPAAYTRAIRDLLGHGEGIFGLVDSYADNSVAPERLMRIEQACHRWRWRLRRRVERLRRVHGDFHPFNILFDDEEITLLDASRGAEGDPADDVACITINYLFFGTPKLWQRFWQRYDGDVLDAIAPFYAWRGLVLASPRWYPKLAPADRARILDFVEHVLARERFTPDVGLEFLR